MSVTGFCLLVGVAMNPDESKWANHRLPRKSKRVFSLNHALQRGRERRLVVLRYDSNTTSGFFALFFLQRSDFYLRG